MSGLRGSMGQLDDLNRTLATTGGVRPASEGLFGEGDTLVKVRAEADGVRRQIEALERSRAPASEIAALRGKLEQIESAIRAAREAGPAPGAASGQNGPDLPGLLRSDRAQANELYASARAARAKLVEARAALAKDAVSRLNLRLSRLLRRARLGPSQSVLGPKPPGQAQGEGPPAGGVRPEPAAFRP